MNRPLGEIVADTELMLDMEYRMDRTGQDHVFIQIGHLERLCRAFRAAEKIRDMANRLTTSYARIVSPVRTVWDYTEESILAFDAIVKGDDKP